MTRLFRLRLGWLLGLLVQASVGMAQSTAGYGDWQLQLPTNHPLHLADAGNRVYVATEQSFYFIDKTLNTTQVLSHRDGLNDVGVTAIAYDSVGRQTVVVYNDTNVDLLGDDGTVHNVPDILRKAIQGDRTISQAYVSGRRAYLASSFGLVVINLDKREIVDTYSAIGPAGADVKVYASTVSHDTLFAATSVGLQVGRMSDNLLDYHNWTTYLPVPLVPGATYDVYRHVATQGSHVYAAIENGDVYVFQQPANAWRDLPSRYSFRVNQLRPSTHGLLIAGRAGGEIPYGVFRLDGSGNFQPLIAPVSTSEYVLDVVYSPRDKSYYTANYASGVLRTMPGSGRAPDTFVANGPNSALAFSVLIDSRTNIVDVFTGGYADRYQQLGRRAGFYEYAAGQWTNIDRLTLPAASYPDLQEVSRGARVPSGTLYVASYGDGLLEWKGSGQFRQFTEGTTGSPLRRTKTTDPTYVAVRITDLAADADGGVWMVNRHEQPGLSGLFRFDPAANAWTTAPYFSGAQNLDRLTLDDLGEVWVSEARQNGTGIWVVDPTGTNGARKFSTADGLPSGDIYDLAKDRSGDIWAATGAGVAVLNTPAGALSGTSAFRAPIVRKGDGTGFAALYSAVVRSIAIDGANRKWFGTDNGLWLFSADADEALLHFTTSNSPLPSNNITDVAVNDKTGEVWVTTDAGVVTYRGSATVTEGTPSCTQVFPNPVRPDFVGTVGIAGLVNNAVVKITDVAGHLVYATTATGGTVTWDLNDVSGRRVRSGVYLVLTSDADGQNGCISKVAVLSK